MRYFIFITFLLTMICPVLSDTVSFDDIIRRYDLKKDFNNDNSSKDVYTSSEKTNDRSVHFSFGKEDDNKKDKNNNGMQLLFDILSSSAKEHNKNEGFKHQKKKDLSGLFRYDNGRLDISSRLGRIKNVKQNRDKILFIMSSGYIVLFSWSNYNTEFIYYSGDLMFNERIIDFEMLGSRLLYLVFSRWSRIRVMIFDTFYGETILNRVY